MFTCPSCKRERSEDDFLPCVVEKKGKGSPVTVCSGCAALLLKYIEEGPVLSFPTHLRPTKINITIFYGGT